MRINILGLGILPPRHIATPSSVANTRTCNIKCAPSQSYFSRYNSVNLTVEVVRAAQWHGIALVGRGAATGSDSGVSR